jgi:PAS domain S-box-containing protein
MNSLHGISRTLTDPERLAALDATGLLHGERVEAFDRLARVAARATCAPVAQVNLLTADQQIPVACCGPEPWASGGPVSLDYSFCQHVIATAAPLIVEDAREHPLTRESRATSESGVVAYASVPLSTADRLTLGSLCVVDFQPRAWTADEVETLRDLAAFAAAEIDDRVRSERRAREALRESEARSRSLMEDALDTSEVGTIILDQDLRVVWVNRAIERFFGLDRHHILQQEKRRLIREHIRHRMADPEEFEQHILATYEDGAGTQVFECQVLAEPDAEKRWLAHWSQPIRTGPYAGGRIEHYYDVTERKRGEEVLREHARVAETLHGLGESFASELDLDTLVQRVTDAATGLTGAQFGAFFYNVLDQKGERFTLYTISGVPREAFSRFPAPRNTPVFEPTFHGTGVVRSDDIMRDPRYGRMEPHRGMPPGHLPVRSYLAVPVVLRSGEAIGGLFFGHEAPAMFTDLHERLAVGIAGWAAVAVDNARLYEAERRARAEAEDANRTKADFLATVSHELRTPLNAMIGYTDLLLMGVPEAIPERPKAQVERIGRSAHHLLELIEEILTFSRIEAGREQVESEEVDLNGVLTRVADMIEPLAIQKGLEFRVAMPEERISMRTDSRKLRQILLNLLGNAVKFTDEGYVELRASVERGRVTLEVADTGIGIEPEQLSHVFEPFFQAETAKHLRASGTGLGLSVARRLALLLGGDVSVESAPGEGSRFTVLLPAGVTTDTDSDP